MAVTANRDPFFDIVRVLCTFEIVGLWHLLNYLSPTYANNPFIVSLYNSWGGDLTMVTMSIFMFISGYYLRKYQFKSFSDTINFYKKRFNRFYLLFTLSAITLFIGGLFTTKSWFEGGVAQLLLTLSGLNTLYPPQPGTIWFMSMLLLFYLLTPIIRKSNNNFLQLFTVLITFAVVYLFHIFINHVDERLWRLYPMFCFGLLYQERYTREYSLFAITLCLITYCVSSCVGAQLHMVFMTFVAIGACSLLVFISQKGLLKIRNSKFNSAIYNLSYSTLALYLFHRQIFQILVIVFSYLGIEVTSIHLYLFWLPLAWGASFIIQYIYDKTVKL